MSACCLLSLSPPLLPTGTLHLSRGRSCQTRCPVRLTERDLDSLQEAYIGGGIKGTDKDKTISLSLSNARTHCPTCTHFSHCSSTSVCVCVGGGGEMGRGHYMLGNSCSCSPSKRRPNLCSYSYMRLSGSELVGCWGSEYKGLAPDTC